MKWKIWTNTKYRSHCGCGAWLAGPAHLGIWILGTLPPGFWGEELEILNHLSLHIMTMFAGAGPRLRCGGLQLRAGGLQLRDEPLLHLRQPARLRGLHQRTPGRQARGGPQLLELSTFNKEKEKNNVHIVCFSWGLTTWVNLEERQSWHFTVSHQRYV